RFRAEFGRFKKAVLAKSRVAFRSFSEGLPLQWEGYKERIHQVANERLAVSTWRASEIGSGEILGRVIHAIKIEKSHEPGNNLVAWTLRYGPTGQAHRRLLEALEDQSACKKLERVLFDLYRDRIADAEAFELLAELIGRRYDVLAYLFFLKNWENYMPISPSNFDLAFKQLEVDVATAHKCSWENYLRYNAALQAVRRAIDNHGGIGPVRLLDAHSFCWMLARLGLPAQALSIQIPCRQQWHQFGGRSRPLAR
ncbi:MAG: hypothetical protein JWR69_504, partial [Pedosphaera sp.]|nr:hypothetical protein [Pedosphaera sp.]